MKYNYENGYVHTHTEETVKVINDRNRGRGRYKIRYDICLRDGKMTPVHENITQKQLEEIKAEIERQGNELW